MKSETRSLSITKLVIYSVVFIAFVVLYIIAPKSILTFEKIYESVVASANLATEEMVEYDYKVYATETKFQNGLENDTKAVLLKFKERGEALAIKIHGEKYKVTFNNEYWIIEDPETIELNIEYYIIPNFKFGNNILPVKTVVGVATDICKTATTIYLCVITGILVICLIPTTIGISKRIIWLSKKEEN